MTDFTVQTLATGDDGYTNVHLYTGYGQYGAKAEFNTVLRIDSSTARRGRVDATGHYTRGTFDHAAQIGLNRERAIAIRDALDRWLEEDYDANQGVDVALAKALVPGTVVRISDTPMWDRDTTLAQRDAELGTPRMGSADDFAGQIGIVVHKVSANDYGVGGGRVVVRRGIDGWSGYDLRDSRDIHVSSLTVVEPDGFHDPTPVYTREEHYQVGDLVIIAPFASTWEGGGTDVSARYYGKAGKVIRLDGDNVPRVEVLGVGKPFVHTASLRNISAEFRAADALAGGVL